MQEAFGKAHHLFDAQAQPWSGTKLGIMATEVSQSDLRIFTNYNGPGHRDQDSGTELASENPSTELTRDRL